MNSRGVLRRAAALAVLLPAAALLCDAIFDAYSATDSSSGDIVVSFDEAGSAARIGPSPQAS